MNNSLVKKFALFATCFAVVVVILGAFTRLSDAGLGCPDWPGCYGFMHIPTQAEHIDAANAKFPERPYEFAKAWPEMVHRYFAGTLGLLVLGLAIVAWRRQDKYTTKHSSILLVLIIFQAALGMWTVTMKLHPLVVMAHLMGGFAMLSLLAALTLRYHYQNNWPLIANQVAPYKNLILLTLVVVALQVALGGWTSANYAAMVCHELPICQGNWLNDADFLQGFHLWGVKADDYEFGVLDQNSRIAIHVAHRIGAIVTLFVLGWLIFRLATSGVRFLKQFSFLLAGLLFIQIVLGVNNIVMKLPLANAVAHNAVGAFLFVAMVCLLTLSLGAKPSQEQNNEQN
ncbi:COX15/CtaA family protein [Aliikangiella sp. IMCC44653]